MLNIIEPTLNSHAGHCFSLVESIVQAMPDTESVRIWAGRKSGSYWKDQSQIRPFFFRTIRKIQSFFLFKRLLNTGEKFLLSTAGTSDFFILDLVSAHQIAPNTAYFYVHWLGGKASSTKKLTKVAKNQPHLEVLCATETTTLFFRGLGFKATTVAYPRKTESNPNPSLQSFKHLLFAGAARMDKGFDRVVDLVEYLAKAQVKLPILIQASTTHQQKHSAEVQRQVERLELSAYSDLTLIKETLSPDAYQSLFPGAISLQPYSLIDFEDRVSGVTLDALTMGCPVVVTADTWLGRIVCQHQAGVAVSDLSPQSLKLAVDQILLDYAGFSVRAKLAGQVLRQDHSALSMVGIMYPNVGDTASKLEK